MFKGRSKGRVRHAGGKGPVQKVPLKGLFTDGVWHCNCEPRLPAQHFQTQNGGKNHGRWCKYPSLDGFARLTVSNYSLYLPETSAYQMRFLPLGRGR